MPLISTAIYAASIFAFTPPPMLLYATALMPYAMLMAAAYSAVFDVDIYARAAYMPHTAPCARVTRSARIIYARALMPGC